VTRVQPRLLLEATVALSSCLIVLAPSPVLLRLPATIVLLFILPGLALLHASRLDRSRDPIERAVVIVGAGTALVVVLAVAIGASPVALSGGTFAVAITAFVLAGLVLAGLRLPTRDDLVEVANLVRRSRPGRDVLEPAASVATQHPKASRWPKLAWPAAIVLTLGSLFIAGTDAQLSRPPIIQLWMLPEPGGARVGVYNGTADTQLYRVVIGPRGVPADSMSIEVPLQSQSIWQTTISLPASWLRASVIEANLYPSVSASAPIRTVWLDVTGAKI
jgi:hypothetical protein